MFEAPGAVIGLEPIAVATAGGGTAGARDIARSQNFCGRKAALLQPTARPAPAMAAAAPAPAPPAATLRTFWQPPHMQQQQKQQQEEAPVSPRRQDLVVAPATASPRGRRVGGGAAAAAATAIVPSAGGARRSSVTGGPAALQLVVPADDGLEGCCDELDGVLQPLPSLVPEEDDLAIPRLVSQRSRKGLGAGLQSSVDSYLLGSPGGSMQLRASDTQPAGLPYSPGAAGLRPQAPIASLSSHGRSLRASSVSSGLGASTGGGGGAHAFPQPPPSPPPQYGADSGAAAVVVSGPESPLPKVSYKAQMRRLRVAVSGLGGVTEDFPCGGGGGGDDDEEDEDGYGGGGDKRGSVGWLGGRGKLLRQQSSGLTRDESGRAQQRRVSTHAWGPSDGSGSVSGSFNASSGGGAPGASASANASLAARPSGDAAVGFSRRLEDIPAAPLPAHSRSIAGGSACSTPGTAGSASRVPLAWQASTSSAGSASSVGFSRRPEDLPAAPSPAHSRSLAGGGGGSGAGVRSGPSTPASPSRLQHPSILTQQQQPLSHPHQHLQQPHAWKASDSALGVKTSISPSTSLHHHHHHQQNQHPPQQQQQLQRAPSGDAGGGGGAATGSTNAFSSRGGWVAPAGLAVAPPGPGAPPPQQHPRRQSSQGIGFSRRAEELPAAPHPAHSRSLAGGTGSSAGSTRSGCDATPSPLQPASSQPLASFGGVGPRGAADSPRTPLSPAVSEGTRTSSSSRRLDQIPSAPPPSQSRSLRPDSARPGLRSHASGSGAAAVRGLAGAPSSPLAWQSAAAAAGGQSRGAPSRGTDDAADLPTVTGAFVEDLSD